MAKEAEEEEERKERETLDFLIKPAMSRSYKQFLDRIRDKEDEFENATISNLEAMVSEKATNLFEVAVGSGTMKGSFTKRTREAAADICAAATVLALKAQSPKEVPLNKQLEDIRRQMQQLRLENQQLRQMLEERK
ncbi:hypothetical protein RF55_24948, partial [Lasius niger]